MSNSATITPDQLRIVLVNTELSGKTGDSNHFSYAGLANSSSSFGQMQFDVGANPAAQTLLQNNGFDDADIDKLSKHGKLSDKDQATLDTKLQAIPQAAMAQFTSQQMDGTIARVGDIIDKVRQQNPEAANAILKDTKLQLGIADYANQFSPGRKNSHDDELAGFLAGKQERGIQAGNPPTRDDMQSFIGTTPYGRDPANARGIAGREERFNEAMGELGLGPVTKAHGHASDKAEAILKQGVHGDTVRELQSDLAALGYTDSHGRALDADGRFGRGTTKAVEDYQRNNGLPVDGVAGPATRSMLQEQVNQLEHARGPYAEPAQTITSNSSTHAMFEAICSAAERGDTKGMLAVGKCYEQSPEGQSYLAMGAQLNQQQAQIQAQSQTINQQAAQITAQAQVAQQSAPVMSR